ncbi:hypothetical protein [Deinococcus multiflagellatus]|uniref:Type II/III secretion system secretin-like domain-containing protein n=1 Tax=Deinococcus multiflagellatus TaxID=1656887 RepID=A0ABW1ZV63_9DEIO
MELTISTIIGEAPTFGASGSISVNKRQVDTVVTLAPKQSVTLGGVITTTELNQRTGVPLLSRIPILGALFSKTTASSGHAVLLLTLSADLAAGTPQVGPVAPGTASLPAPAPAGPARTTTSPGANGTSSSVIVPPGK